MKFGVKTPATTTTALARVCKSKGPAKDSCKILVMSALSAMPPASTRPKVGSGNLTVALAAVGTLAAALALAACVQALQARMPQAEKAVMATGMLFAVILAAAPGLYVLRMRRSAQPEVAGLAFVAACSVVLLATYFFCARGYVFFPADIWIWSESGFLNDILKFSTGHPLFTAPANLDSDHYMPAAPLLTYLLAWMAGKGGSIAAYRVIQVIYTALAAYLATLCCRQILRVAWPESRIGNAWGWNVFWYAALFLIAANSITNRFVHNLNVDALAQMANMAAFYAVLVYIETRSRRVLVVMALLGPLGFLIKQTLLIWAIFYGGILVVWGDSRKRLVVFAALTSALFLAIVAAGYSAWSGAFVFWILQELSKHAISPLRAFQHVLDSWTYFAAVLLGGVAVLRGRKLDALFGTWLISLGLLSLEAYTSGIEWMLNHMGPGCLMAGVWFLAGLASFWSSEGEFDRVARPERWIRSAAVTASLALMFGGLGMVRIPLNPVSADTYRYVHDIEREFQGRPPNEILLDVGTWVYAKDRVIMGDRAPAVGMLAMAREGNAFADLRSRLEARRYSKILVRNLHEPDFWYENDIWPRPSGLRDVLLDNYRETGHIRAASGPKEVKNWAEDPYLFGEIAILEPK
jgi:hypothetical protein